MTGEPGEKLQYIKGILEASLLEGAKGGTAESIKRQKNRPPDRFGGPIVLMRDQFSEKTTWSVGLSVFHLATSSSLKSCFSISGARLTTAPISS